MPPICQHLPATLGICLASALGVAATAQSNLEQDDPNAIGFGQQLTKLAASPDPAESAPVGDWMLAHRDDQQIVYFIADEPLDDAPASRLRRKRAENLLRQAADVAKQNQLANAYRLFWQAAREDPRNAHVLRAIGIPQSGQPSVSIRSPPTASRQLGWPGRSYLRVQTPHYIIDARCERSQAAELANELERFYWIWTQVFFPLWHRPAAVKAALTGAARLEPRPKRHRVVVFSNRQAYIDALAKNVPGIERSAGFYSNKDRITFLFAGAGADTATLYHELTHQLIGERTNMRVSSKVGLERDFWIVEGIATYMESLRVFDSYATVGGWESPRLQYSRYRVRSQRDAMPLERLIQSGRDDVQQSPDIARWYSFAAAYTHLYLRGKHRTPFFDYVRDVYENRSPERKLPDKTLGAMLNVSDTEIQTLRPGTQLQQLCLANTDVTNESLEILEQQSELRWLDLSGLPVEDEAVANLIGNNPKIDQLSLERTRVGDATALVIAGLTKLEELDLSVTSIQDAHVAQWQKLDQLRTLWLTASSVSDQSIETIASLPKLVEVDLQSTKVSEAGIGRLRGLRPNLRINPLQMIADPRE